MASYNFSNVNSSEFQTIDRHFVNGIRTRQCVIFWIDTFATLFALIVIIWKSSKEMKAYKWFLLNIVIWSYLMAVNLTVIYVPLVSLFPAPVMCILGVANRIENLFYANYVVMFLLIELLGACGAAIVCTLYYKYRFVMGQPIDIFHKKSVILGIALFHLVNGLPCLICLIYTSEHSAPDLFKNLHETFRKAPNYWLKCGALDVSALSTKIFVALCASEILLYVLIVVSGSVYVYVCHKRMLAKSSEKTRSIECQWIIALLIQATIPIITLACPFVFMAISVLFRIKNVVYTTPILIEISSLHPFLNVLAMFLTVKSYRDAILDIILCKKHNRVDGCEKDSSDSSLNWYWSLTLGL